MTAEASQSAFGGFTSNSLVAEARKYLGTNPTGRASLWCGAFMDLVLKRTGHAGGGNLARAYANYGRRVSGPQVGAIAVLTRRGGGHVGVVSGVDANGNPIVVSGNHNRTVAEAVYPSSRVIAYVMPGG
ncbi:MAG: TIGR02594 family protein [Pseudolabrys sp.]